MNQGTFLAEFEMYVMLAIARLGDGAYGVGIRKAIEGRTGRPVSIGAVYATTSRLAEKGFLEHEIQAPRPVPGGRARKVYRLTPSGGDALAHSSAMMRRMMEGLDLEERAWAG